eukprot:6194623-Pleurochrysis_carterae.AAC.1
MKSNRVFRFVKSLAPSIVLLYQNLTIQGVASHYFKIRNDFMFSRGHLTAYIAKQRDDIYLLWLPKSSRRGLAAHTAGAAVPHRGTVATWARLKRRRRRRASNVAQLAGYLTCIIAWHCARARGFARAIIRTQALGSSCSAPWHKMASSYSFVSNSTVRAFDVEPDSNELVVISNDTSAAPGLPFNSTMYEALPSAVELVFASLLSFSVLSFIIFVLVRVSCTNPLGVETSSKGLSSTLGPPEQPAAPEATARLSTTSTGQLSTAAGAHTPFERQEQGGDALAYEA